MENETTKHKSFGQIRFSRVQSTGVSFYGSELTQNNYIQMEVFQSEIEKTLTCERYYTREPLLKLRMTSNQFAELITSLNMGSGVPCTVERIQGIKVEELPTIETRKEYVHKKFNDRMTEFADKIRQNKETAKNLVKKKTLSKDDIRTLTQQLDFLTQEIESNIPYFLTCFQESMDEVTVEAKMEIENAIQHKINVLGLEMLKEQHKILNEKNYE